MRLNDFPLFPQFSHFALQSTQLHPLGDWYFGDDDCFFGVQVGLLMGRVGFFPTQESNEPLVILCYGSNMVETRLGFIDSIQGPERGFHCRNVGVKVEVTGIRDLCLCNNMTWYVYCHVNF